jgi:redox-sensitive bicupin YhaK (pirin superfamily)
VLHVEPAQVPQWRGDTGDRVRVLAGSFEGLSSPLIPAEPFTLLDVQLRQEISLDLSAGHNAVVYVRAGYVAVRADGHQEKVDGGHALALRGGGGHVRFEAFPPSHFLVLSGAESDEPVVTVGPFIMNDPSQIEDAFVRYRTGAMGYLAPLSDR